MMSPTQTTFLLKYGIFLSLGLVTFVSNSFADTVTGTLNVTAAVPGACTINTVGTLAFGNYNTTANSDALANINVTCTTPLQAAGITLGGGLNSTAGQRRVRSGATTNYLNYNLYTDAGRTTPWVITTTSVPIIIDGTARDIPVYGRIPSGQASPVAGNYTDTVGITVTYNN